MIIITVGQRIKRITRVYAPIAYVVLNPLGNIIQTKGNERRLCAFMPLSKRYHHPIGSFMYIIILCHITHIQYNRGHRVFARDNDNGFLLANVTMIFLHEYGTELRFDSI